MNKDTGGDRIPVEQFQILKDDAVKVLHSICQQIWALSRVQLLATSWTAAYQAPPPMGFSRQEYWSGVPLASPTQ